MSRGLGVSALCVLLAAAGAAQSPPPADPLLAQVDELLKQARREIQEFEKAGGSRTDTKHPVGRWVETLWEFRDRHPATPAAGRAGAEAIHLLVHADRMSEVRARTERLQTDDPAWEGLGSVLLEAAALEKDYGFAVRKLKAAVEQQTDTKARSRVRYALGRAYFKLGDLEAARAAFRAVIEEAPGSPAAKEAEPALYEALNLGYGQPAPSFSAKARDGSTVSLADSHGQVLLVVFWTST
jgi:tetratricopeptide (TPR) repeat protein